MKGSMGMVLGWLIATVFGLVFVEVNSGGLPGGWTVGIRLGAAAVAAGLVIAALRVARMRSAGAAPDRAGFADRRYWVIVGLEAVALFGGLVVINAVLSHSELAVAWVAVVVGAHFFGLAYLWRIGSLHVLGTVLVVLGAMGFVLGGFAAPAGAIGLVSGVGSGLTLFAGVGAALVGTMRRAGPGLSRAGRQ
jgi:hypothetical protein